MAAQTEDGFGAIRFLHNATQETLKLVFFARLEASLVRGESIKPEHLLLALTRQQPSLVGRFLTAGDSVESLRSDLIRSLGTDPDLVPNYNPKERAEWMALLQAEPPSSHEVPLSQECGQLLILAFNEGRREQVLKTNGQEPPEMPVPEYWNRSDTPSEMTEEMKAELARMEEAAKRGARPYVQPKHVLIAILSMSGTPAEQILTEHGVRLDDVRKALAEDEAEE